MKLLGVQGGVIVAIPIQRKMEYSEISISSIDDKLYASRWRQKGQNE